MNIQKHREGSQFAPNIARYFIYTALKGFGFGLITATWLIYLQQRRGFSLTQATFIDVAFWIAAALGELPTGIVADTYSRKTSLVAGAGLMSVSIFAWALAPTMPLIMTAYVTLALGVTFLSGAEDAFFFESLRVTGRVDEYTRLAGRVNATLLGATALGNVASGLLASVDLILPFLTAGLSLLLMLAVVLMFREPRSEGKSDAEPRRSYKEILQQSLSIMRVRPTVRYVLLYAALVPMAAIIMETFFLQPQAVSMGVPIAGVGVLVMGVQITNMLGSTSSHRIELRFGQGAVLYAAPVLIVVSLILLAALQLFPALLFVAIIGFVTAVLQPLLLSRIQTEVPDSIRATILSMQSLMFTSLLTISEPVLGVIADRSGLPAAYYVLAGGLAVLALCLFWISRRHFPQAAATT